MSRFFLFSIALHTLALFALNVSAPTLTPLTSTAKPMHIVLRTASPSPVRADPGQYVLNTQSQRPAPKPKKSTPDLVQMSPPTLSKPLLHSTTMHTTLNQHVQVVDTQVNSDYAVLTEHTLKPAIKAPPDVQNTPFLKETLLNTPTQNVAAQANLETPRNITPTTSMPLEQSVQTVAPTHLAAPAIDTPLTLAPQYHHAKVAYPRESQRLGEQGHVLLSVKVNMNGEVSQVDLKQSSGYPRLDRAALYAVRSWRFIAAKRSGIPVDAEVEFPIQFTLE